VAFFVKFAYSFFLYLAPQTSLPRCFACREAVLLPVPSRCVSGWGWSNALRQAPHARRRCFGRPTALCWCLLVSSSLGGWAKLSHWLLQRRQRTTWRRVILIRPFMCAADSFQFLLAWLLSSRSSYRLLSGRVVDDFKWNSLHLSSYPRPGRATLFYCKTLFVHSRSLLVLNRSTVWLSKKSFKQTIWWTHEKHGHTRP
jgi:hypothetical protein